MDIEDRLHSEQRRSHRTMMPTPTIRPRFLASLLLSLAAAFAPAQTIAQTPGNSTQQLAFAGFRSVAQQGQINAVKSDAAGNLFLLFDQKDGVRVLKTDNAASQILAQATLGAKGDIGLALALDPAGNVYVTGTSTSGTLSGTAGAAFPSRTDASTNSFVAKFDSALNPVFVTFTGGSKIATTVIAATADAVFVTGVTYAANLPVTSAGIQQAPAAGSLQNGFVEKFSASGGALLYATYLTGAQGDTTPSALVAGPSDAVYIAGSTSAPGFPTVAALVPAVLSNPSGFLTKLTPAGDGITFSTFIPGAGLSSLAFDSTGQTLLATGSVALGQFPVDTVANPLIPTTYQVLLRLPLDGSSVLSAVPIAPGTQSFVAAAPAGAAWVNGVLTAPLLAPTPLAHLGLGFAARVTAANVIDQTARFGGLPTTNSTYAGVPTTLTSLAVDTAGEPIVAGAIQPTASSSLLASELYDVPLRNAPTSALPSSIRAAELTAATCQGSLCAGSAAYLAKLNPNASAPALAFSADELPFVILRNLGSAQADGLALTTTAGTLTTNCAATLVPGGECNVLLSGGTAGTLTATATTGGSQTLAFPAYAAPASTIAFYPRELDFGILTSTSPARSLTLTLSNLGTTSQTVASALQFGATGSFTESSSDCTLSSGAKLLAPGATCHITVGFAAFATPAKDGFVQGQFLLGDRAILLTGYSQAASLSVSAAQVDFGTQFAGGLRLPRFLYVSNSSTSPISHAALALPASSAFLISDSCPATLLPASVCRIRIDYLPSKTPATDSTVLAVDGGNSVLLTGQALPARGVTGSGANPNLSVTPTSITFPDAVPVTATSASTQTVSIFNSGTTSIGLALTLTGDFIDQTSCTSTLAAGATCAVVISFVPAQPGLRQGLLTVAAGANSTPVNVTLTGTGTALFTSANNGSLDFGNAPVGQPVVQFFKITQPFNALTAATTGPFSATLVEDTGFGPGQPPASAYAATYSGTCHNCYLAVRFTPTAAGPQTGTLTLSSSPTGTPYKLNLTGTGTALTGLVLTPSTHDFGSVAVHSVSAPTLFTLTNNSSAAVTLPSATVTGDFTLSSAPSGSSTCVGPLAPAASCFVQVAFTPTATGTRTGTLTVGPATASLSGLAAPDSGIALNPTSLTFNNVPGLTATQQTITITNTGSAAAQIGTPTSTSAAFTVASSCASLLPGASCTLTVTYRPGAATATATLSLPITIGTAQTTNYAVALNGTYTSATAGLQILPLQANFGPTPTGTQGLTQLFTINNLTAKSLALNLTIPRQYTLVGPACTALAPNASCSFSVAFTPLTASDSPGTLFAQATPSDGSPNLTGIGYVEGYGTGHGTLTVTGGFIVNGAFNFGQVASGQTSTQTFTLVNRNPASSAPITVRRVTSGPPFLSSTTCGGVLAVGQSCTVTVAYTPLNQVATGTNSPTVTQDSGTLTLESDANSSPDLLNLTGQAGPTSVGTPNNTAPLATFTLSQSSLAFARTLVGNASPGQTSTLTNTGTVPLHVTSVGASADFTVTTTCATVVPGATCTFTATSTPQSSGPHFAALAIHSDSTTSLEFISLTSTADPSPLAISPASLDFGTIVLSASSAPLNVTLTNNAATPITITSITATGDYTATNTCPAALAPAATCTAAVTFSPTVPGTRPGTLSVVSSASTLPLTVALTGIGARSGLTIAPSSLAFGSIALGTPVPLTLTLSNTGLIPITNIALTTSGDYAVTQPCALSTLTPGTSCSAQITFTPTALGVRPGTLLVTSSDPASPATVPLTGSGIQTPSFTLSVNGASSATATAISGQPATFLLTLSPLFNFTGAVALTCTPVTPAPYASCSLLPSTVTLAGGPQTSIATINTITSAATQAPPLPTQNLLPTFLCLLLPSSFALWLARRRLRHRLPVLLSVLCTALTLLVLGCGGGSNPPPSPLRYTPAGAYQYQVTASSTTGTPITQTVTLTLNVTPR